MVNRRNNYFIVVQPPYLLGPSPAEDGGEHRRMQWKARVPRLFFFDDRNVQDCARAYAEALAARMKGWTMALYRPTLRAGAWDEVPLVGHRDLVEIRCDITAKRVQGDKARGSDKRSLPPVEILATEAAAIESAIKLRRRTLEEIRDDEYS